MHENTPGSSELALERTINLYTNSIRDYFATFSVYATATSILAIAIGSSRDKLPDPYQCFAALLGLWVCFQWHIATFGTRLTYRYYWKMIEILRQRSENDIPPLFNPRRDIENGVTGYPWSAHQHKNSWGARGASLPVVYGGFFLLIFLNSIPPISNSTNWRWFAVVLTTGLCAFFLYLVGNERRKTPNWDDWRSVVIKKVDTMVTSGPILPINKPTPTKATQLLKRENNEGNHR